MSAFIRKVQVAFKATQELGIAQVGLYAVYQIGLQTGFLRWRTRAALGRLKRIHPGPLAQHLIKLPDREQLLTFITNETQARLLERAELVFSGKCRIFDSEIVPLVPELTPPVRDWTQCKPERLKNDVKFIWEPARFGWVFSLAMAYLLTGRQEYPQAFWEQSARFFKTNPPFSGWQWVSAQEVALRLISLTYASQVFATSPSFTPERQEMLARWIAIHAARIPPTMAYARSQNNNHLLSEAAGLFSAGMVLPLHPDAKHWKRMGWRWFCRGLNSQISGSGAYIQHSTSYHRLILMLAIWMDLIQRPSSYTWSRLSLERLRAASKWLATLLDPVSGKTPNLGPNDGAYILPLSQQSHSDYRPVLQAAYRLFFNTPLLPSGDWDDLCAWMGIEGRPLAEPAAPVYPESDPLALHHPELDSWCYLRAARFDGRPGHADQLHLDVWWNGQNIAMDAGTYSYNAEPPWNNALTHTAVHNTVELNGQDQMTRAGRFLYLDWAQAEAISIGPETLSFQHDGYRKLGLLHQRTVRIMSWGWQVTDQVTSLKYRTTSATVSARLHWLLPDWTWQVETSRDEVNLRLDSPIKAIRLSLSGRPLDSSGSANLKPFLVRAGKTLYGNIPDQPTWGWVSPAYSSKMPALAFGVQLSHQPPFALQTEWHLSGS